jgi:Tol biopolymer transport system component
MPSVQSVMLRVTRAKLPQKDIYAVWSSENDTVYFQSNRSGNWDIWSVPAKGGTAPVQVTDWPSREECPSVSPDGKMLAFRSDKDGNPDIWVIELATGELQQVTSGPGIEAWPVWSTDGQSVYFASKRSGFFNLWEKSLSSNTTNQITFFDDFDYGLPEVYFLTKFAVNSRRLILPLEERSGHIYLLEFE